MMTEGPYHKAREQYKVGKIKNCPSIWPKPRKGICKCIKFYGDPVDSMLMSLKQIKIGGISALGEKKDYVSPTSGSGVIGDQHPTVILVHPVVVNFIS